MYYRKGSVCEAQADYACSFLVTLLRILECIHQLIHGRTSSKIRVLHCYIKASEASRVSKSFRADFLVLTYQAAMHQLLLLLLSLGLQALPSSAGTPFALPAHLVARQDPPAPTHLVARQESSAHTICAAPDHPPGQMSLNPCPEHVGAPILACSACGGESETIPGQCQCPNRWGAVCKCNVKSCAPGK